MTKLAGSHVEALNWAMKRHFDLADRALKDELRLVEEQIDSEMEEEDADEEGILIAYNDHWIETAQTLPLLQWSSTLIMLYALFERSVNDRCADVRRLGGYGIALRDVYGQGIERARTYLSKVAGLSTTFSSASWARAVLLSELRNALAHRAGFVDFEPTNAKSLYSRLNALEHVELVQEMSGQTDALVSFGRDFVEWAHQLLQDVDQAIHSEITSAFHTSQHGPSWNRGVGTEA